MVLLCAVLFASGLVIARWLNIHLSHYCLITVYYLAINFTAWVFFITDKDIAKHNAQHHLNEGRIRNRYWVNLAVLGGALGELWACYLFAHKSAAKYRSLRIMLWICLVIHSVLFGYIWLS